jgi:hypothetical protein
MVMEVLRQTFVANAEKLKVLVAEEARRRSAAALDEPALPDAPGRFITQPVPAHPGHGEHGHAH